jgi:divalent metal cation (Fe/Co/Zn/Cd) transporter
MTAPVFVLTSEQRGRERAILFALMADYGILALIVLVALYGGSLTLLAESVRGFLMVAIEAYSLVVLRKIHRGRIGDFEFGAGKLEQMCNVAIAVGMIGGALWIADGAVGLVLHGHVEAVPLGLALGACLGAVNVYINYMAWLRVREAARGGRSVIMQAQLDVRRTKLVSSGVVQVSLTVAALAADPVVAAWADCIGAVFVAGILMVTGVRMLREGLPDMLDRSVDEATHLAVLRVLAHHFASYDRFERVRSRRSGGTAFVEISLAFDGSLPLAEIHERARAIKDQIAREIEGVDITILLLPHGTGLQRASAPQPSAP